MSATRQVGTKQFPKLIAHSPVVRLPLSYGGRRAYPKGSSPVDGFKGFKFFKFKEGLGSAGTLTGVGFRGVPVAGLTIQGRWADDDQVVGLTTAGRWHDDRVAGMTMAEISYLIASGEAAFYTTGLQMDWNRLVSLCKATKRSLA